jgi:HEPN domain-containing protein
VAKKTTFIKTDKPFWFFTDQADEDYLAARLLTFCGNTMWHVAAYHSHQASEKYIKSFLVQENQEYPETHNLKILREIAAKANKLFDREDIKRLLEEFDQFEQVSRYGGFANYDPISVKNDQYTIVGGFVWTDNNLKSLDKLVSHIRGLLDFSEKPTLDGIKAVLDDNKKIGFVSDWRLPTLTIRQILTEGNAFFK